MNRHTTEAIKARTSIRKYSSHELPGKKLSEIFDILTTENEGPFGNMCRFWLIDSESYRNEPVKLGTYGFISGLRYIIAGTVTKGAHLNMEDYGYVLERKIIQFTRMGLGTCWIGGTFRRSEYAKTTTFHDGEIIPAITPIGFPGEKQGFRERVIKYLARSKSRKEWSELFFDRTLSKPLTKEAAGIFANALEMVRIAPSANNAQPWRIIKEGKQFHFFLARNKVVKESYKTVDLQRIDLGIAIAHFDLSLREEGISGLFQTANKFPVPEEWTYITSYTAFFSE
ncbi:MAG: nitroreductase [Bacteroidales bacterium]|nr:nitroreductase [Bacteroidales bacterium]